MHVVYLGHFDRSWTTETHLARELEGLGHTVDRMPEPAAATGATLVELEARARSGGADLVLWTRVHPLPAEATQLWRRLEADGIKTASYHLDLYWGLNRPIGAPSIEDPFWSTGTVLTADGGSDERFAAAGINHVWMPPAVVSDEAVPGRPQPGFSRWPVVFVGQGPTSYPREWPWRSQLICWLRATYRRQFMLWPRRRPIRDLELNDLYASATVVVGDTLCPPGHGRYWCVDADTEALTFEGWKRFDQIRPGLDALYAMDRSTGLGRWEVVRDLAVFDDGPRPMVLMDGQRHSSLTTPDHRWWVAAWSRDGSYRSRFRTTAELGTNDRIPLSAPSVDLPMEPKLSDDFVELVAWAWTEGAWSKDRYTNITQSIEVNSQYVSRIRQTLTNLYGPPVQTLRGSKSPAWRESLASRGMVVFAVNQHISAQLAEVAPGHQVQMGFVRSLTKAQLHLFLQTSIDADGCRKQSWRKGTRSTSTTLAQRDAERLDPIEAACALLGIPTNKRWYEKDNVHLLHLKVRTFTQPVRMARQGGTATCETVVHDGPVWCPVTSSGTWLARRRGTVYFTGNSDRLTETIGRGGFLLMPWIDGIEGQGFVDGEHLRFYRYGDLAGLRQLIDHYLAHPDEARQIARQGQAFVAEHHTYRHRMQSMLDQLGLGEVKEVTPA